jgi:hypothetical protein
MSRTGWPPPSRDPRSAGRLGRSVLLPLPLRAPVLGLVSVLFLLLSLPAPVRPQATTPPTGVVVGTVTDEEGRLLRGAEVRVEGAPQGVLTARDGRFRIARVPAGPVVLEIGLMGYRSAALPIEMVADATLTVAVELGVEPVPLEPVEVRARTEMSVELQGFYDRRERGGGHYLTRDEIGRMQSRNLTDILRRVPGVRVEPAQGPMGTSYIVRLARTTGITGGRPCPVMYYVNGMPFSVAHDVGINNFIRADEIAGLEVYSGASRLPPQFHSSPQNARCGVIVIWTYAGERRQGR